MGIESASDDRSTTCLEGTAMGKLAAAAAVGIVVVAVVAEDYMGVVDVAVGRNRK